MAGTAANTAAAATALSSDTSKVLQMARSVAQDAKRLQEQLVVARGERDEALKAKAAGEELRALLGKKLEAATAELSTAKAAFAQEKKDLEEKAQSCQARLVEERALRSEEVSQERALREKEVGEMRSRLEGSVRDRALLATETEALRAKLAAAEQEMQELRLQALMPKVDPGSFRGNGKAQFSQAAQAEVAGAWEALVKVHLARLRKPLEALGVKRFGAEPSPATAAAAARGSPVPEPPAEAGRAANGGHQGPVPVPVPSAAPASRGVDAKGKKEKKRKKRARDPRDVQEPHHRDQRSGKSALRKSRSGGAGRRGCRVSFPAYEANVTVIENHRPSGLELWHNNPSEHVECEQCGRRCGQQAGRLHGGRTGFTREHFVCGTCLDVSD